MWEHGNIGKFWKGTREQGPLWKTLTKPHVCFSLETHLQKKRSDGIKFIIVSSKTTFFRKLATMHNEKCRMSVEEIDLIEEVRARKCLIRKSRVI